MSIIFDDRWVGNHGIGRFARELSSRVQYKKYKKFGNPASPFDPFLFSSQRFNYGDWIFSPGINAPFFGSTPYFLTIHDLNIIDVVENRSLPKILYYNTVLKHLINNARGVFTVSNFSKNRISNYFNFPENKIYNIGNGVSDLFSPTAKRDIPIRRYLLCVSNRKAYKNELRLIEAFSNCKFNVDIHLYFTGNADARVANFTRRLGVDSMIRFLGDLTESELATYYAEADGLVCPSLYEGFGLPVVEGFASGIPVAASNSSAIPEVSSDAALLFDPYCIDDMRHCIEQLVNNSDLRNSLILKGFVRSKFFSWDLVFDKFRSAIESADVVLDMPLKW